MQQQQQKPPKHEQTEAAATTTVVTATARPAPTVAQINAQQKADAERNTAVVPVAHGQAVATHSTQSSVRQYLDDIAPASIVGRMAKFAKDGPFVTYDDGKAMSDTIPFAALCDQTLIGVLKFNGPGEPPDRRMGLLYDGFVMPDRASLGDTDPAKWEIGLDGKPADPWQHHVYLVLQNTETEELFTFVTSSRTGRRAVGNLLRHYDRVRKTDADFYPLVNLKVGGFQHSDSRVGWVATPVFAVVGRIARADAAKPDAAASSTNAAFNDSVPF
jgi:hypothetical protein